MLTGELQLSYHKKENFPTYLWMLNLPPKGLSAKFKSERESEIRNKEMGGREERKWKESWERERERDKFSREWKSDFWIWRFGHESVCVVGFTADHSSRWSVSTLACCLVSSIFTFAFKSERHPLFLIYRSRLALISPHATDLSIFPSLPVSLDSLLMTPISLWAASSEVHMLTGNRSSHQNPHSML